MSNNRSRKEKLVKRLRYLWTWELFDSFFLPAVVIFSARTLQRSIGLFTIYSAGLVTLILWQGTAYWWLKLRAVRTDSEIGRRPLCRALPALAVMKKVNWVLIGMLPVLLGVQGLVGTAFRSDLDVIAGLGLYVLAVLEQINYYHYQLMYDTAADWPYLTTHKRLKRSKLYQDLSELRSTGSP